MGNGLVEADQAGATREAGGTGATGESGDSVESRVALVLAAGDYYGESIAVPDGAMVIAADGGYDHARAAGIRVDYAVGDFDSIVGSVPEGEATLRLPPQKDDPDLLSALKLGWSRGARTFHIHGALGGRIDHTMSAIRLVGLIASRGGIGFLYGDGTVVTAVADGALSFAAHETNPRSMVSVFALGGDAHGVTETGLRYELSDANLDALSVLGLSNEFRSGVPISIAVRHGVLAVTFPRLAPLPTVRHDHGFSGDLGALDTQVSRFLHHGQ